MTDFHHFSGQDWGRTVYKHIELPVYMTDEFNFYRCLEFRDEFYGWTASRLFNGNLRICTGRYASLFGGQKLSYWADSPATAMAEIKKHGAGTNILTFWAYDDGTSTFPTLVNQYPLIIIDGRECGVQELIDKADQGKSLSDLEKKYMQSIMECEPDCLAYDSHAKSGGQNYLFFEKGFQKLALRELRLRFGRKDGGSHKRIICADTSDYMPFLKAYGYCFMPKARLRMDESYLKTDEYLSRKAICDKSHQRIRGEI